MNQTFPSKVSVFDSSVVSGSNISNQKGDVNKSIDNIEQFDYIIDLIKDNFFIRTTAYRKKWNN